MQTITNPFLQMPNLQNAPAGAKTAPLAGLDGVFSSMLLSLLAPAPVTMPNNASVFAGLSGALPVKTETTGSETSLPVGLLLQPESNAAGSNISSFASQSLNRLVKLDSTTPITSGSRQILNTVNELLSEVPGRKAALSVTASVPHEDVPVLDTPAHKTTPQIVTFASLPELEGALVITLPADSVIPVSVSTLSTQHSALSTRSDSSLSTQPSLLGISVEAIREALVQNGVATPAAVSLMSIETPSKPLSPAREAAAQTLDRPIPNNITHVTQSISPPHQNNKAESKPANIPAMNLATVVQSTDIMSGGLQVQVRPEALLFSEDGGVFLPVSLVAESPERKQSTQTALVQLPLTLVGQVKESPKNFSGLVNVQPQDNEKPNTIPLTMVSKSPVNNNTSNTVPVNPAQEKMAFATPTMPDKPAESASLLFLVRNTVSVSEQSLVRNNIAIHTAPADSQQSLPNEGRLAANIKTPAQNPVPLPSLINVLQHEGREMNARIEQIQVSAGSRAITAPEIVPASATPLPLKAATADAPDVNPETAAVSLVKNNSITTAPASPVAFGNNAIIEAILPSRPAAVPSAPPFSPAFSPSPAVSPVNHAALLTADKSLVQVIASNDQPIQSTSVPTSPADQTKPPASQPVLTSAPPNPAPLPSGHETAGMPRPVVTPPVALVMRLPAQPIGSTSATETAPAIQNNTPAAIHHTTEAMRIVTQTSPWVVDPAVFEQASISQTHGTAPKEISSRDNITVHNAAITAVKNVYRTIITEPAVLQPPPAPSDKIQSTGPMPKESITISAPAAATKNESVFSSASSQSVAIQTEPIIQEARITANNVQALTSPSSPAVTRVSERPAPVTIPTEVQNTIRPAEMPILENTAPVMDRRPNITAALKTSTQSEVVISPAGKQQLMRQAEPVQQEPVVILRSDSPVRTVALQVATATVPDAPVDTSSQPQNERAPKIPSPYFAQHPRQTQETSPAAVRSDNTKAAEGRERTMPVSNETVNPRTITRSIPQPTETVTPQPIREEAPVQTVAARTRELTNGEARPAETEARRPFEPRPVEVRNSAAPVASERQSESDPADNRPVRNDSITTVLREVSRHVTPEPRLHETRRVADIPRQEDSRVYSSPDNGRENRPITAAPVRENAPESEVNAPRQRSEFKVSPRDPVTSDILSSSHEAKPVRDELINPSRETTAPHSPAVKGPETPAPVSHPAAVTETAPPERTAPVRMAETTTPSQTVPADEAEVTQQIVRKASLEVSRGRSEMQIRLEPESLGTVRLRITVENGAVTARVVAENPETHRLLERNAPMLRASLEQSGLSVERIEVAQTHSSERQGHTGSQQNQQQNNPQQGSQPGFQQNAGGETHRESHQSRHSYTANSQQQPHQQAREELQETPRSWMANRKFGRREYTA